MELLSKAARSGRYLRSFAQLLLAFAYQREARPADSRSLSSRAELLTRAGLVPAARIDEALERQLGTNRRIGELLVEMGLLHRTELAAVISIQEDLRDGRVEAVQMVSARLGSILLNAAAVSDSQLERALVEQAKAGGLLGDILVRQGSITPAQRNGALKLQRGLAGRLQGRFLIGRLLVDGEAITEAALERAILRQQASGRPLGELLVEAGQLASVMAPYRCPSCQRETMELIELAEQQGFEYGWTYDSHVLWQEPYPLLTLAARATGRRRKRPSCPVAASPLKGK